MCPLDTVILRSQGLYPAFFTESWCGPAATPTVEGVLPTKFPSISMSAPSGVEDTSNCAPAAWSGDMDAYRHELEEAERRQRLIILDIFGNPFRPPEPDPRWLTGNVVDLARAIYAEKAFERMPILADALMDAGCNDEQLLEHCRSAGPHVRGCWALDLTLGE